MKSFTIEEVVQKGKFLCLKFENFQTEREVSILLDKEICLDEIEKSKIGNNVIFIENIIGSKVIKDDINFGTVKNYLFLPANDVYVIEKPDGNEVMIPAVSHFIDWFDKSEKILRLKSGIEIDDNDDEN